MLEWIGRQRHGHGWKRGSALSHGVGKVVRPDWDRERLADIDVLRKYVYGVALTGLTPASVPHGCLTVPVRPPPPVGGGSP